VPPAVIDNGLEEFDKNDFYRWDQHWSNRMILRDSLLVMTSLIGTNDDGESFFVRHAYFTG
jgi:hypothetical protein